MTQFYDGNLPPARQAILNDTRTTVQHFHFPPQPTPQIVNVSPPPLPPKTEELLFAGVVFGIGVLLIAIVTGFSTIWFSIVLVFLGIVALIAGCAIFGGWLDRNSRSQR